MCVQALGYTEEDGDTSGESVNGVETEESATWHVRNESYTVDGLVFGAQPHQQKPPVASVVKRPVAKRGAAGPARKKSASLAGSPMVVRQAALEPIEQSQVQSDEVVPPGSPPRRGQVPWGETPGRTQPSPRSELEVFVEQIEFPGNGLVLTNAVIEQLHAWDITVHFWVCACARPGLLACVFLPRLARCCRRHLRGCRVVLARCPRGPRAKLAF